MRRELSLRDCDSYWTSWCVFGRGCDGKVWKSVDIEISAFENLRLVSGSLRYSLYRNCRVEIEISAFENLRSISRTISWVVAV